MIQPKKYGSSSDEVLLILFIVDSPFFVYMVAEREFATVASCGRTVVALNQPTAAWCCCGGVSLGHHNLTF
jgi:hypothetical protein